MANVTLSISDELKARMAEHPHVRWSAAIRSLIEHQLDAFEEAERAAQKSRLTEKDVDELSQKVRKHMAKRMEALLRETRH